MPRQVFGCTAAPVRSYAAAVLVLVAGSLLAGCQPASDADPQAADTSAPSLESSPETGRAGTAAQPPDQDDRLLAANQSPAPAGSGSAGSGSAGSGPESVPAPAADPPSIRQRTADTFQLPADASADQLLDALGQIDRQMQRVATQQTQFDTRDAILAETKRLATLKLEAANRLAKLPDLPPETVMQRKRGKLQALSHLLALGDAKWAGPLQQYARTLADSADATLAVESRLVLLGFAIERLQVSNDPQPIVDLVGELAGTPDALGMPALLSMAQARSVLHQYGYSAAAREVREAMVTAFASHSDPNLQAMAADLANAQRYDVLDALRRDLEQDRAVTPSEWQSEAQNLVRDAADLGALRYLSEAALHFEVSGMKDFAEATYEVIRDGFADVQDADLRYEQQAVLATYRARQEIIGEPLEVDLPDTTGAPFDYSSLRGQVVLMPFWAAEHPESISVFRLLESIRDQHPNQVAILGVNVDLEEQSLAQFERQFRLDWPSLRSPDPLQQGTENPLAIQTGVTSFPFVVLIDQAGIVRRIFLTAVGIEQATEKLLAQ